MENKIVNKYIVDKDNFDRLMGYLAEIEIKANELADKYEKKGNDDFERFFDTLKTAGMFWEQTEADSEKIYYGDPELVKLDESQCIVDKYVIMTKDKRYTLGETMTLKELMDAWWNCISMYKNGKYIGSCYKRYNGNYCFEMDDMDDFEGKANNKQVYQWLIKKVVVSNEWDNDADEYPVVSCELN